MRKDVFGFSQCHEKGIFGLGYNLTLTRNTDVAVLNKDNAINNAKFKIIAIEWYVPHYTPNNSNQIIFKQILSKSPTKLQDVEGSVFKIEVNTQNFWTFQLGKQEGINFPIWNIAVFQQRHRQDSQNLNSNTFYRPPVTSTQCNIGTKKIY